MLSVIGSGFGRTGTRSLKEALEILGFSTCHHMEEVFDNPSQVPYWQSVARGEPVDWHEVFSGYRAQVDWPGSHVWRELSVAFPNAKVVHSVRPDDAWWNSFSQTIGKLLAIQEGLDVPPHIRDMMGAAYEFIGRQTFDEQFGNREKALAAFHRRTADVRATIPPERLLVFDVAEGWGPLCNFLGVAIPEQPFPRRNGLTEFWDNLGGVPA